MKFKESTHPLGFIEAFPRPSKEMLIKHYRDKYYQEDSGSYSKEYSIEEKKYFLNIAKVAERTISERAQTTTLLDLGCGEGFFSAYFHQQKWNVWCCDFSGFALAHHNDQLIEFFLAGDLYETIQALKLKQSKFGLVNLQNVLEHVLDPLSLLQQVKELLNEESVLRIRVPNDYSEFQLELERRGMSTRTWFAPPEHLSYFNNNSLINVLNESGYDIISMQADFPIEVFLANKYSNYWQDRSVGKEAHKARVFCENFLIEQNVNAYINYSQCAAELGFGRELIVYAIKNGG